MMDVSGDEEEIKEAVHHWQDAQHHSDHVAEAAAEDTEADDAGCVADAGDSNTWVKQ